MSRPRGSRDRHGKALRTPHDNRWAQAYAGTHVGAEIRFAREAQDIAASELAAAIGVDPSTVHQWERGVRTPPLFRLLRIAWALGVTPSSLLGRCD